MRARMLLIAFVRVDDMGLDVLKRTYVEETLGGVAANYYPHIFEAYIEDESARVAVLGKQPHGVSSVASGELEVMLHRRTNFSCCGTRRVPDVLQGTARLR